MKKRILNVRLIYILGILFLFIAGCDDEEKVEKVGAELIGTWTVTNAEIDAMVGDQSLTDYFVNVGGLSPENAAIAYSLFELFFLAELNGTIEFRENNTYISNFGNDPDEGTWSLISDGNGLILDAGTDDEIIISITSLSSTTANLLFSQEIEEDLDDDPSTPEVPIDVDAYLELTKQ
jgi:hypothetical protein